MRTISGRSHAEPIPFLLLFLQQVFDIKGQLDRGAMSAMMCGNWFYAGFFFGFTGYFCRPARGLVC
jgi:hypothetical protein